VIFLELIFKKNIQKALTSTPFSAIVWFGKAMPVPNQTIKGVCQT
jgi:hypothetical protein